MVYIESNSVTSQTCFSNRALKHFVKWSYRRVPPRQLKIIQPYCSINR